jgi:hypothetical protein
MGKECEKIISLFMCGSILLSGGLYLILKGCVSPNNCVVDVSKMLISTGHTYEYDVNTTKCSLLCHYKYDTNRTCYNVKKIVYGYQPLNTCDGNGYGIVSGDICSPGLGEREDKFMFGTIIVAVGGICWLVIVFTLINHAVSDRMRMVKALKIEKEGWNTVCTDRV